MKTQHTHSKKPSTLGFPILIFPNLEVSGKNGFEGSIDPQVKWLEDRRRMGREDNHINPMLCTKGSRDIVITGGVTINDEECSEGGITQECSLLQYMWDKDLKKPLLVDFSIYPPILLSTDSQEVEGKIRKWRKGLEGEDAEGASK